jgi:hypothetical protein
MKKTIVILFLLGAAAPAVHAQQKTAHHLMVTFYENSSFGGTHLLIETHEDGSQTKRDVKFHNSLGIKGLMEHEDTLMLAMKSYFDQGWKLESSTATVLSSFEYTTRFFLRKEE